MFTSSVNSDPALLNAMLAKKSERQMFWVAIATNKDGRSTILGLFRTLEAAQLCASNNKHLGEVRFSHEPVLN